MGPNQQRTNPKYRNFLLILYFCRFLMCRYLSYDMKAMDSVVIPKKILMSDSRVTITTSECDVTLIMFSHSNEYNGATKEPEKKFAKAKDIRITFDDVYSTLYFSRTIITIAFSTVDITEETAKPNPIA